MGMGILSRLWTLRNTALTKFVTNWYMARNLDKKERHLSQEDCFIIRLVHLLHTIPFGLTLHPVEVVRTINSLQLMISHILLGHTIYLLTTWRFIRVHQILQDTTKLWVTTSPIKSDHKGLKNRNFLWTWVIIFQLTLTFMAHMMLYKNEVSKYLGGRSKQHGWHVTDKTSHGRTPGMSNIKPLGCKCFIVTNAIKFDVWSL